MKQIKVLHLIKTLKLGGAEKNLLNLVQAIDATRYGNFVAYSSGGELEKQFLRTDLRLYRYAKWDHRIQSFAGIAIILKLIIFILKHKIDIIHSHSFNTCLWGGVAARLTGRRIIEHVHDYRYLEPEELVRRKGRYLQQFRYVSVLGYLSDIVAILTRQNRDYIIKRRLHNEDCIREIRNGIAIPIDSDIGSTTTIAVKEQIGIPRTGRIVFTTARLAPTKNPDLIIRIAPRVIEQIPNAYFVVAGSGPLLEDCKARCSERKLAERVKFIGFCADVNTILRASDVFLLPSFLELHSISILEAMSMKVPVVVSRNTGCNDEFIRNGENGVLLDPFSDEGWADALIELLENDEKRKHLGQSGYETCVGEFDIKDVAGRFQDLYDELQRTCPSE